MTDRVSTGCGSLDGLLGGGLDRGTITQFYGPPASGKTNVAIHTAVCVAAAGGTAVYIDTEGLSLDRLGQLVEAYGGDDLTDRIVISEAHDFAEQRDAVKNTTDLAPDAELIVIDSATGFYRLERSDENGEALRAVARQFTSLLGLARKHDLAVLTTNQVYTDPDTNRTRPLGGHTLAHWTGVIVALERFRGGNRRATLEKHHSQPAGDSVSFRITQTGIESADDTPR